MRNCFVPGCDSFCKSKNINQRKMFLAPKGMLDKWKETLANKRDFKPHDRVCERHFLEEDIIEFWENNINGEIHRTKRDKPKLRENAVPSLFLPTWSEFSSKTLDKEKKAKILSNQLISSVKRKIQNQEDQIEKKVRKILVISPTKDTPEVVEDENYQFTLIDGESEAVKEKKMEAFENVYDEAFDVTLPNTLWGIHRDPERKFLVFSCFDGNAMKFSKYLHIDCELKCQILSNGKIREENLVIGKCTTDFIAEWLEEIDMKNL